ncbi:hypothetical protein BC833DRAFT_458009 [Globomyces pollinis-pini]|nr:hypothetical protein BC833DRAFT_458009 [Globomyces pollinis-pini]
MTACHTTTQCMTQDVDPVVVQKAVTIQKECGLGNNTCINKCSGKGVCGNNGCRCEPGFGGVDCSISLTTLITYNPVSQKYAPNKDAYLLPVKQEYPAVVVPAPAPGYVGYVQQEIKSVTTSSTSETSLNTSGTNSNTSAGNTSSTSTTTTNTSGNTSGSVSTPNDTGYSSQVEQPISTPGVQTDSKPKEASYNIASSSNTIAPKIGALCMLIIALL